MEVAGGGKKSGRVYTLALIRRGERLLLGYKKRGFGAGLWNGFGGKVEAGESVCAAAGREIAEECGLQVKTADLRPVGRLLFRFEGKLRPMDVRVFAADHFQGEPTESEEMAPRWYNVTALPLDQMWPDDAYWYPLFLQGRLFQGEFLYRDRQILDHQIQILNSTQELLSESPYQDSSLFLL